ncbi:MAG TPA: hypothetical protein VMW50_02930 [Dehalococcoidia bacterium]|nr:hypothetical protein [Dehalococcoidia bacterium]
MKFAQPKNANYYDLVRTPHGHIPAPMIKFWSWLPIPIKGQRDWGTFHCPVCGSPSFFKTGYGCDECQYDNEQKWKTYHNREKKRRKWKRLEYAMLPLLVLIGKAWYLPSIKLTLFEQREKYGGEFLWEPDPEEVYTDSNCAICGDPITWADEIQAPDHPQCCEEHGDYLELCVDCYEYWENQSDHKGCIRAFFNKNIQPIEYAELRRDTE